MTTRTVIPALLVLALLAGRDGMLAAQEFEGVVRMRLIDVDVDKAEGLRGVPAESLFALSPDYLLRLKSKNGSPAVSSSLRTYYARGRSIRMEADVGDESSYVLIDLDRAVIYMVSPADESYLEISIPELTAPLFPMLRSGGYNVVPLNRTMTLNGMEVTGYEAFASDNRVRAWLSQGYPGLTRLLGELARSIHAPNATAEDRLISLTELGAPLLVQLLDMDGKKLDDYEVQEIISVREQSLDPRLFQIPEGYRKRT